LGGVAGIIDLPEPYNNGAFALFFIRCSGKKWEKLSTKWEKMQMLLYIWQSK
jgi:hypothetical protein